jgi:hypothetical protein
LLTGLSRNSSFDPGGQFQDPPISSKPQLRFRARPRLSIYLDTDKEAVVLVDARVVFQAGEPIPACYVPHESKEPASMAIEVSLGDEVLAVTKIRVGSTENQVPISLTGFEPRFEAYELKVVATLSPRLIYSSDAELYYLPYPEDYGSVSRLDNLYGALFVQRGRDNDWERIFPYTYYGAIHPCDICFSTNFLV